MKQGGVLDLTTGGEERRGQRMCVPSSAGFLRSSSDGQSDAVSLPMESPTGRRLSMTVRVAGSGWL